MHLASHLGGKPEWREEILAFVPGEGLQKRICAGAVNGVFGLAEVLADGYQAGSRAALDAGYKTTAGSLPKVQPRREEASVALFQVPHEKPTARAPKQFVDPQNDVTAAAIELACREGFESIEHVKRYTALGFGTDQGKLGNINGLAIAARAQGKSIADTGTTMFRPNYTPVTFGAVAGRHCGHLFEPVRFTALHAWHVKNGAEFEDVGQWKRPWYFRAAARTCTPPWPANAARCARRSACSTPRPWARSTSRARTRGSSSTGSTPTPGPSSTSARRATA